MEAELLVRLLGKVVVVDKMQEEWEAMGALLGFGSNQERIVIKGEDISLLKRVGQDLLYYIENLSETRTANLSTRGNRPEALLAFDALTMARNDITPENIAMALRDFGQQSSVGTSFKYGNEDYNIIIRESEVQESDLETKSMDDLRELEIQDQRGRFHKMKDISTIRTAQGSDDIRRINQQKQIEINYTPSRQAEQSKELLDAYRENVSGFNF